MSQTQSHHFRPASPATLWRVCEAFYGLRTFPFGGAKTPPVGGFERGKALAPTSGGGDFLVDFSFRNLQSQKCFSHLFF